MGAFYLLRHANLNVHTFHFLNNIGRPTEVMKFCLHGCILAYLAILAPKLKRGTSVAAIKTTASNWSVQSHGDTASRGR